MRRACCLEEYSSHSRQQSGKTDSRLCLSLSFSLSVANCVLQPSLQPHSPRVLPVHFTLQRSAHLLTAGRNPISTIVIMSSRLLRIPALAVALSYLLSSASARVVWLLEDFNPNAGRSLHSRRDDATCASDPTLNQCPGDFPPNFCCSPGTTCLHINTNNLSITAALCCPDGVDCKIINPVSCEQAAQDATQVPDSQLHSIPPQQLDTCGGGCCPMGYTCNDNNQCVAQVPLSASSGSSPSSSTPNTTSPTALPGSESTSAPTTNKSHPFDAPVSDDSSSADFNGKSFVAGLVPGLAIGAILAALVIFCCMRRKKERDPNRSNTYYVEKSRDTLTDLSTLQGHPTMHGRSISQPTVDPSALGVTRTDFLRSSPTRTVGSNEIINNTYSAEDVPKTPANRTPKIKALFSRSPFLNQAPSTPPMTQPPMPAHLKRGTLSFQISPIRALKKQKSMHSLRRQMTESRTDSTETIQVLMSPDDEPSYKAEPEGPWPAASAPSDPQQAKRVPYASSSRYPSELPQQQFRMPTPPPPVPRHQTNISGGPSFLDSPYTPTKTQSKGGGLAVPESADPRRETTFSTLMEKAGLRKSELVMGTKKKIDGKFGL